MDKISYSLSFVKSIPINYLAAFSTFVNKKGEVIEESINE